MRNRLVARAILATKARPAIYRATADGEAVATRAAINEAASKVRAGRSDLIVYQATATVPEELDPAEGGRLEQDGTVFEIEQTLDSSVPGLLDLGLSRVSGSQHVNDRAGVSRATLATLGESVTVDGRLVRGVVARRSLIEDAGEGQVEIDRVIVSVADADAAEVGAEVTARGRTYRIHEPMPNGRGLTLLVLE